MSENQGDPNLVNLDEGGTDEQILREFSEFLPKKGDRLFVENSGGARLDPLGLSDPLSPESRSIAGRRGLYSAGYLLAGDRLVLGLTGMPHEDALIYPILYLYRHHIELELKGLISYVLHQLSGFDEAKVEEKIYDLQQTHSLKSLWNSLQTRYPDCNNWASGRCQKAFRDLLFELDDHDPLGQAARYETGSDGNQTLTRLSAVDLPTLKVGVHKISNYLRCIYEGIGQELDWRSEMASW